MTRLAMVAPVADGDPVATARSGRWPVAAAPGLVLAAVSVVGVVNAARYPAILSYDGAGHLAYADGIVHGRLPHGTGEFFQPPGFYAVASVIDWLGEKATGLGDPHRATQALNVALFVASLALIWLILREVWPRHPIRPLIGMLFVAMLPVTERSAVMFHPEMLDLFLTTFAVWLTLRLVQRPSLLTAGAVGAVLGLAQLVRAFALSILAAVAITLLLQRLWRHVAVVVAVAVLVPAPWYVRQTIVYGSPLPFNRTHPKTPLWERRPLKFYVGLGLPEVVTRPYRPSFVNEAIPTTYSELWGDYFGHWRWNGSNNPPQGTTRDVLRLQNIVGLLPTLLAVGGWLALLARARRASAAVRLIALVPLIGLAEYTLFTVTFPSPDGDVLKATYLLTTTIGWAAGFACAVSRLPRWVLIPVALTLFASAIVEVPFLVFH